MSWSKGAIAELESAVVPMSALTCRALEIPIALALAVKAKQIGARQKHQGCVALGCVIQRRNLPL